MRARIQGFFGKGMVMMRILRSNVSLGSDSMAARALGPGTPRPTFNSSSR